MKQTRTLQVAGTAVALGLTFSVPTSAAQVNGAPCGSQKVGSDVARPGSRFGETVALDGDLAVLGAPRMVSGSLLPGAAFAYERIAGVWRPTALLLPGDAEGFDQVGAAVAISGTTVLVGAPHEDANGLVNAGSAYVFEHLGGVWMETGKWMPTDSQPSDLFGTSVAIDGDVAVVGAEDEDQGGFDAGAAYIFERIAGTWTETAKLVPPDLQHGDGFGTACAVQGDRILVGALSSNTVATNAGAAYVYERGSNGWELVATLHAWDATPDTYFGLAVAIAGNRIAIGTPFEDEQQPLSGAVYTFELQGSTWFPLQKLKAPDPEVLSKLGSSVSLDGPYLLAGSSSDDNGTQDSGSAHLFRDDGAGYVLERKFHAPDAGISDFFGHAVGLSDNTALIGAYNDDDSCTTSPNCGSGTAWFYDFADYARAYCFGESCPCGNPDPVRGCAGSTGFGAELIACGTGSVLQDDAAFAATGLAPDQPSLLFRGHEPMNAGAGFAFGDGLRCAGENVKRLGARYAGPAGDASWGPGLASIGGWQAGDTFYFQVLYRDLTASPCGTLFNTTQGLEATFTP